MKKTNSFLLTLLLIFWLTAPAMGHGLWINIHKSDIHPPGHVMSTIGFGHLPPNDDLLQTEYGSLEIESYSLIDPENKKTELPSPRLDGSKIPTAAGINILTGDLGACRMGLSPESLQGTYQVTAKAKDLLFSMWIDQKGRKRMKPVGMDQIDNPKTILVSMLYKANAKSSFTVGDWGEPSPLAYDLEIVPVSDLSGVNVGDEVEFEVTLMGKPLSAGPGGLFHMTAINRSFGGPDKTFLMSYLQNGRCSFRMPAAGQWLMMVKAQKAVADVPGQEALKGKCQMISYTSSFTFEVLP